MKAIHEVWGDIRVSQLNRLLRQYNVKLVLKTSRAWGDRVTVTAVAVPPVYERVPLPPQPPGAQS